jgi:hypothetical protein
MMQFFGHKRLQICPNLTAMGLRGMFFLLNELKFIAQCRQKFLNLPRMKPAIQIPVPTKVAIFTP